MVLLMFLSLVINVTHELLLSWGHVIWRESVSVRVQCQGSKTECAGILQQSLSVRCALPCPIKSETAVYGYDAALFLVLSVLR